ELFALGTSPFRHDVKRGGTPHASDENTLDAARRPRRARRVRGERAGADPRRRLFAAVSRTAEDRAGPLRGPAAQRRAERTEAPDPRRDRDDEEGSRGAGAG